MKLFLTIEVPSYAAGVKKLKHMHWTGHVGDADKAIIGKHMLPGWKTVKDVLYPEDEDNTKSRKKKERGTNGPPAGRQQEKKDG